MRTLKHADLLLFQSQWSIWDLVNISPIELRRYKIFCLVQSKRPRWNYEYKMVKNQHDQRLLTLGKGSHYQLPPMSWHSFYHTQFFPTYFEPKLSLFHNLKFWPPISQHFNFFSNLSSFILSNPVLPILLKLGELLACETFLI